MIVESESGAVQWELKLNSGAGSPGPATLPTADHRSAFLMWGDFQEPGNETVSAGGCSSPGFGPELGGVTPFSVLIFPSVCAADPAASCTGCVGSMSTAMSLQVLVALAAFVILSLVM